MAIDLEFAQSLYSIRGWPLSDCCLSHFPVGSIPSTAQSWHRASLHPWSLAVCLSCLWPRFFTELNSNSRYWTHIISIQNCYYNNTIYPVNICFMLNIVFKFFIEVSKISFQRLSSVRNWRSKGFYSEPQSFKTLLSARFLLKNVIDINVSITVHF